MIDIDNMIFKRTLFACFFSFIIIGFLVNATDILQSFDREILIHIMGDGNALLIDISKILHYIGSVKGHIALVLAVLIYSLKNQKYDIFKLFIKSAIATGALIQLFKLMYGRIRPEEFFRIDKTGMSFPSGHAMGAMSLYLLLAYIVSKENKTAKNITYIIAVCLIVLMGWSRLYLGIHWPSDVIGGYLGGISIFIVMVNIDKKKIKKDHS